MTSNKKYTIEVYQNGGLWSQFQSNGITEIGQKISGMIDRNTSRFSFYLEIEKVIKNGGGIYNFVNSYNRESIKVIVND